MHLAQWYEGLLPPSVLSLGQEGSSGLLTCAFQKNYLVWKNIEDCSPAASFHVILYRYITVPNSFIYSSFSTLQVIFEPLRESAVPVIPFDVSASYE